MLRIAVCDDEAIAVESIVASLKRELAHLEQDNEISVFTSSRAFTEQLEHGTRFQIFFSDIDMPELDGIDLGVRYQTQLADTILIYISNRDDLVFDAFAARPFRFIRKEYLQKKLPVVLRDALAELRKWEQRKIAFACGVNNVVMLYPEHIHYVEAVKHKQFVYCEDEVYEVNSRFQEIKAQLLPHGFVQTHRSFLVNCRFIHSIANSDCVLDNGKIVPVSRTSLKQVHEAFWNFTTDFKFPK